MKYLLLSFIFFSNLVHASESESEDLDICQICWEVLEEDDSGVMTTLCCEQKIFHESCLSEWLRESQTCPNCRVRPRESGGAIQEERQPQGDDWINYLGAFILTLLVAVVTAPDGLFD